VKPKKRECEDLPIAVNQTQDVWVKKNKKTACALPQ